MKQAKRGTGKKPEGGDTTHAAGKTRGRWWLPASIGAGVVVLTVLAVGVFSQVWQSDPLAGISAEAAEMGFVGSETCASCHATEGADWSVSQHAHAMDHATETTVLGDFDEATFEKDGVVSRFFRDGDDFMVETDGPDGDLESFKVDYTFGLEPLQQYLITFPDGRIQALSVAWDTRPEEEGGQRWFHLYPDEAIPHDDVLHWTKLNQNWNFMCAECHSTGVRKNYDAAADSFDTTWTEITVGCESCHGAGLDHVEWARAEQSWWPFGKREDPQLGLAVRFDERTDIAWIPDPETSQPTRSTLPGRLRKEVETCGLCHARRAGFSEAWVPGRALYQTHAVTPLAEGLYFADGQMLDEVYNYGSFKQSKMFDAGVTCSDCHDPHTAELKLEGDGVCLQCHVPEKYEAVSHSHHEGVSPPVGCSECHMPERTYMVVDPRHDHSFRIPRPDLSVELGTPNTCNDCHTDRSAAWAAAAVESWFGPDRKGHQSFAPAFHAGWENGAGGSAMLAAVAADPETPAIARATALEALASRLTADKIDLARTGLRDPDPMVRIGALAMIEGLDAQGRWTLGSPLLSDPVRGVRIRAASLLAGIPPSQLSPEDQARYRKAADELVASHEFNADRPESRSALGSFYLQRGQVEKAEAEYQAALRLSPRYAPAAVNLADLHRLTGDNEQAETILREALDLSPDDAGLHHALGLALVRLGRQDEALVELAKAVELDPENARNTYVYGVGLHSAGDVFEAIRLLGDYIERHPENRDILLALAGFTRETGDTGSALKYARQILTFAPEDPQALQLVYQLSQGSE